jgi:hypothetical protein
VPANHATQESHYALVVYALLTVLLSAKITPTAVEDLVTAHLISPRMVPALLTLIPRHHALQTISDILTVLEQPTPKTASTFVEISTKITGAASET